MTTFDKLLLANASLPAVIVFCLHVAFPNMGCAENVADGLIETITVAQLRQVATSLVRHIAAIFWSTWSMSLKCVLYQREQLQQD